MIFLRQLAADFVELLRIFQRTDRQRCCKTVSYTHLTLPTKLEV